MQADDDNARERLGLVFFFLERMPRFRLTALIVC